MNLATRKLQFIILPLISLVLICHALHFNYISDDAFISFRYVKNFIQGNGLVYNIGEKVEGYTNFLWVIILSLFAKTGFDIVNAAKGLGIILGILNILCIFRISTLLSTKPSLFSFLPALLVATCAPFAVWITGGLETHLFTFLILSACLYDFKHTFKKSTISSILFALAVLTRPDGIIIFAASMFVKTLYWMVTKDDVVKNTVKSFTAFSIIFVPYFLWRYFYFGYLFPNTYYVRAIHNSFTYMRGVKYVTGFFSEFGWFILILPFLCMIIFCWRKNVKILYIFTAIISYFLFVIDFGGDQLVMYRFLVPIIPFLYILVSETLYELYQLLNVRLHKKNRSMQ